jgi:hypothetical protein
MTRPTPIPGGVFRKSNPTMLDADMTRTELVYSLEHLTFSSDSFTDHRRLATISIDRGVRDFLLNAIRRHD